MKFHGHGAARAALPLLLAAATALVAPAAAEAKERPDTPGTATKDGDGTRTDTRECSDATPADPTQAPPGAEKQTVQKDYWFDDAWWAIASLCADNVIHYVVHGACIDGDGNAVSDDPGSPHTVTGQAWGSTAVEVVIPDGERSGERCVIYAANTIGMRTAFTITGNGTNSLYAKSDARDIRGGLHVLLAQAATSPSQSGTNVTSGKASVSFSAGGGVKADVKSSGTSVDASGAAQVEALSKNDITSEASQVYHWNATTAITGDHEMSATVNDSKEGRRATWACASWEEAKLTAAALTAGVTTRVDLNCQDTDNVIYTSYVIGDPATGGGGPDGGGGTPPGEGSGGDTTSGGGGTPPGGGSGGDTTPSGGGGSTPPGSGPGAPAPGGGAPAPGGGSAPGGGGSAPGTPGGTGVPGPDGPHEPSDPDEPWEPADPFDPEEPWGGLPLPGEWCGGVGFTGGLLGPLSPN